jgi:hypothetical protein
MSESYEGWANKETWALNLVLSNDESLYEMTKERVRDALEGCTPGNYHLPRIAGEAVEQLFDELTDLAEGLLSPVQIIELLREVGSVWRIDWREIGAAWLENLS